MPVSMSVPAPVLIQSIRDDGKGHPDHSSMMYEEATSVAPKVHICTYIYGVATISRLLKIIGLFCKRAL